MKKIAFLIPVHNKEESIAATVRTVSASATALNLSFETIAIDDGSTDRSVAALLGLAQIHPELRVVRNPENLGFARTYFKGLEHAESEYVMYISADDDISEGDLRTLLSHIGSKDMILQYCGNYGERNTIRRFLSRGFTKTMNFLNGADLKYYNGLNIYPARALRDLRISESSFAFQADIVSRLLKVCSKVEVPIRCGFADHNSSALRIANILGVSRYLFLRFARRLFWIQYG